MQLAGVCLVWREDAFSGTELHKGGTYENASFHCSRGISAAGLGAAAAQDVVIEPEQETVIREYVKKQPLASVKIPGVELNLGSTLPETVELHAVPNTKYRTVVVDNRTVVVDPGTRKIIKIIE